jgi:hypothetical protein
MFGASKRIQQRVDELRQLADLEDAQQLKREVSDTCRTIEVILALMVEFSNDFPNRPHRPIDIWNVTEAVNKFLKDCDRRSGDLDVLRSEIRGEINASVK